MKVLPNAVCVGSRECDVRDYESLLRLVRKERPTHIINLAAISNPLACEQNPELAWDVNVKGTENVLMAGKEIGAKVILFSSAKVYENGTGLREDSKLKENGGVYVSTKLKVEELGKRYGAVIIRPFNQEGPGRGKEYFTSKVILSALNRNKLELWNPDEVREFMDVRDGVEGIRLIALKGKGTYNLSSGTGISKLDYLRAVEDILGRKIEFVIGKEEGKNLVGNNEKLRKLGWGPKYCLKDTIKAQAEYLKRTAELNNL